MRAFPAVVCGPALNASGLAGKPVEIITGRGNHSKNGVGVLGPAVRNALTTDGWAFDAHPGGIIIRGMRAERR